MIPQATIDILNFYHDKYNHIDFIINDPIQIPHRFSKKQDIEIAGLFAATLAWGNRKSIVKSCTQLLKLMDNDPHQFILHHASKELKPFESFVHRTFNATDVLYFIAFLKQYYSQSDSMESLFVHKNIEQGIAQFHHQFFSLADAPHRTKKHISTPEKKSTCKRLNMYLRWMVRKDKNGVDFGIWKKIKPSQLICPLDVHVIRVAVNLGLLDNHKGDWNSAELLTKNQKKFDENDPV